jgi:hypothetical protein
LSCNNSDDGHVSANVGGSDSGNDDGGGCSGHYNDADGLSDTKVIMISLWYHFVPHLVINHLEADKCLFFQINFYAIFYC